MYWNETSSGIWETVICCKYESNFFWKAIERLKKQKLFEILLEIKKNFVTHVGGNFLGISLQYIYTNASNETKSYHCPFLGRKELQHWEYDGLYLFVSL